MTPEALAALDRWIAEQAQQSPPRILTRQQALEYLAADALIGMGLLRPSQTPRAPKS